MTLAFLENSMVAREEDGTTSNSDGPGCSGSLRPVVGLEGRSKVRPRTDEVSIPGRAGNRTAAASGENLGEHAGDGGGEGEDGGEGRAGAGEGSGVGGAVEEGEHARRRADQEGEHDDQGGSEQDDGDVVHGDLPVEVGALTRSTFLESVSNVVDLNKAMYTWTLVNTRRWGACERGEP